jgi:6,7-dimethyl-8-ribityllumazine synthase
MLTKNKNRTKIFGKGLRIAIVAACYNENLMNVLLANTLKRLSETGVRNVTLVRVPGSYEIPVVAAKLARSGKYQAIIALGVILQGKTSHAKHIAQASCLHLQKIAVDTGVPVVHQILTPRNLADAKARVGIRGKEAAETAVAMASLMKSL